MVNKDSATQDAFLKKLVIHDFFEREFAKFQADLLGAKLFFESGGRVVLFLCVMGL